MKLRQASLLFATLALTLVNPVAAKDKPVEVLTRTAKWDMHYDDDSCSIWGQFGEGKAQIAIRMTRYQPDSATELALYGQRLLNKAPYVKVATDFNSDGTSTTFPALSGKAEKLPLLLLGTRDLADRQRSFDDSVASLAPDQQDGIASLTITIGGDKPIHLPLSPAAGVWGAMRTCTTNLVRTWGFDPDEQASLSRRASPLVSPQKWLRSDDYPNKALETGQIGVVRFRLDIAPDGTVSGCHVQMQSKPHDFSAVTCRAIELRARFDPALDKQGKAVRSYFVGAVNWVMHPA